MKREPINDKGLNKIEIVLDMSKKTAKTMIGSNMSAYDSLFVAIEGIAVLVRLSLDEGVAQEDIVKKIKQLNAALVDYDGRYSLDNIKTK